MPERLWRPQRVKGLRQRLHPAAWSFRPQQPQPGARPSGPHLAARQVFELPAAGRLWGSPGAGPWPGLAQQGSDRSRDGRIDRCGFGSMVRATAGAGGAAAGLANGVKTASLRGLIGGGILVGQRSLAAALLPALSQKSRPGLGPPGAAL